MANPLWIVCHHAGGSDANPMQDSSRYTVSQCNQDHKIRFNMRSSFGYYVGYQYVITYDGVITQCRRDDEEGAHTVGRNSDSIGILLCGNFDATLPTKAQEVALKGLLERKMKEWNIPLSNIVPHRKFASKTCFGRKLPDDWAQKLVSSPTAPARDTINSLTAKLVSQNAAKDYRGARDTASLLFTEYGRLL